MLTYIDHEPYGNMRTKVIYDEFFREVEKQSRGNIKLFRLLIAKFPN
ncbi:hypothetical protein [Neisseria chenwenguii]|nr:hypothetical protein [Neisseria chenwenguii]